jgi:hypothetical protein
VPVAAALITPDLPRVGSCIRTLTRSGGGGEEGTFTDKTRPTAEVAELYAESAARYLALQLGKPNFDPEADEFADFVESAKDAAAAYAALKIATSFYDDGSDTIAALIDQLGRMAREQIKALVATAQSNSVGGWRIHRIRLVTADVAEDLSLLPHQIANGPDSDGAI